MHSSDSGSGQEGAHAHSLQAGVEACPDPLRASEMVGLLPLIDAAVLDELEDELAGSGLAQRFAGDFVAMWDERYARLAAAVGAQNRPLGLDAAISLKVTSLMVGALRLAKLAELAETAIRHGDFGQSQALMEKLAQIGGQTVRELRTSYVQ